MFKLSTKSVYGLKALCELALNGGDKNYLRLEDIARKGRIPLRYLEQVFNRLKNGKIVKGLPGPGGGYKFLRPPDRVYVLEVVNLLEGWIFPVSCYRRRKRCNLRRAPEDCVLQYLCSNLDKNISEVFMYTSIGDMCRHYLRRKR